MTTTRKTINLYWQTAQRHKSWMMLHIAMIILAVIVSNIIEPYIMSRGINALPEYLASNSNDFWGMFRIYILGYLAASLTVWVLWRVSATAGVKFEIPVMRDLHRKVFTHLMEMSNRFFNNTFSGSLVSQTNRFVNSFERLYDVIAFDLTSLIIKLLFATIILATFSPIVALGMLGWAIVFSVSAIFLSVKKFPYSKRQLPSNQKLPHFWLIV